jgi:hypothetical protein
MVLDCENGYQEEVKKEEGNCPPESFAGEEAIATAQSFQTIGEEGSHFEKSCSRLQELNDASDEDQQSKKRRSCCNEESEEESTPGAISVFAGVFGSALRRGVGRFAGIVRR